MRILKVREIEFIRNHYSREVIPLIREYFQYLMEDDGSVRLPVTIRVVKIFNPLCHLAHKLT